MMRADALNWHDYGSYTKMTDPSSDIYSTDEDESKRIILHKTLSQNCSASKANQNKASSKKTLSQKYSTDVDKLCSTEIEKVEYTTMEQKDDGNEVTYTAS